MIKTVVKRQNHIAWGFNPRKTKNNISSCRDEIGLTASLQDAIISFTLPMVETIGCMIASFQDKETI